MVLFAGISGRFGPDCPPAPSPASKPCCANGPRSNEKSTTSRTLGRAQSSLPRPTQNQTSRLHGRHRGQHQPSRHARRSRPTHPPRASRLSRHHLHPTSHINRRPPGRSRSSHNHHLAISAQRPYTTPTPNRTPALPADSLTIHRLAVVGRGCCGRGLLRVGDRRRAAVWA